MADERDTRETVVVEKDGNKINTGLIVVVVIVLLLILFFIFGNPFGGGGTTEPTGGTTDVNVDTTTPTPSGQ